jgi:glycosyltransferase involved in cell wall biosynthesis
MKAVFDNPDGCARYIFFGYFTQSLDNIPYFSNPKQLIHSNLFPVVNKVPYVIDMENFYFPYLIDYHEFRLIHELKKPIPLVNDLTRASRARLEVSKKLLSSKFCRKILPWSKWCRDYIMGLIDDPEIIEKIELLYPAVNDVNYKKEQHKGIRLLYCGGWYASFRRKGGEEVLQAFDVLRYDYSNLELIFIGTIPKKIYDKYKKYKNIKFYDFLEKKRLFEMYRKSDIFVLPTRNDTFGFSLLEAMNFSLPIITTKGRLVPATKEIVDDGVSGFLIERKSDRNPHNIAGEIDFEDFISKLRLLIENKNLREKMGRAGKKEITDGKFSIKKRNKRLREIYEEALK